ncbi:hypothetical protein [Gordonibacter urolithinfaciens]|uniref:hypothetical protein n=1 Tax=Gordonibacter urolithinfaciens TaxID=1335613 RepID=UPI0034BDC10B
MSYASLVLGKNWCHYEWPEYVSVSHLMSAEPARRYVRERTCTMEDCDQDGYMVPESLCGDGFCSQCWGIIDVEDKFCRHCGARIEA